MIKRTLLTALLYLAMIFTFCYLFICFAQWEFIKVPPINEWSQDDRTTILLSYFGLCFVAFMVELEIRDKKKRSMRRAAEDVANDLRRGGL